MKTPMTWTPRNTINVVLCSICLLVVAVLGGLDGAHVISGAWITPAEAALGALLVGLVTPGSPVGRMLDAATGQGAPPTAAEIAESLTPKGPGAALLLAMVLSGGLAGCGASALATQARAATIAGVAMGSVGQELHDERAHALDACHDTACEDSTTGAWAPAVAAYESARAALTTWIEALDVARQAGEPDGDILGALFVAVSRIAREWNQLAAALRGVGVEMPDLPPALAALLGAGAAS